MSNEAFYKEPKIIVVFIIIDPSHVQYAEFSDTEVYGEPEIAELMEFAGTKVSV